MASGRRCSAALSAPAPVTDWKRSGTSTDSEMTWKLAKKLISQLSVAARIPNRCIGTSGSGARRSCSTNSAISTSAAANSASICGSFQRAPWPTSVIASSRLPRPAIISIVPR